MATIVNTLIQGLSQQMVQARLNTADATPFLFATHFPVRKVNGFIWRTLQNQLAKANVAADLHTDNGTILRKRRPIFESAKGDIPFISISRELSRSEIKEYQTALAFAQDDDATKLVQYWGEDVDFCFNGVQSELEYIAWKLASNAGVLKFTTTTNATYANEFDLDYDVDDEMKVKTTVDWANKATADIIGDLRTFVKLAKDNKLNPKFAFVNLDEFYKIASADQIIKLAPLLPLTPSVFRRHPTSRKSMRCLRNRLGSTAYSSVSSTRPSPVSSRTARRLRATRSRTAVWCCLKRNALERRSMTSCKKTATSYSVRNVRIPSSRSTARLSRRARLLSDRLTQFPCLTRRTATCM